jgi:hypothetical protein
MRKWLLAVAVAAVLTGDVQADSSRPQASFASKFEAAGRMAFGVYGRLYGRLLGCCIHKGMTKAEAERLIGSSRFVNDAAVFGTFDSCGKYSVLVGRLQCFTYGLEVPYYRCNDGVERVGGVLFFPLFD